MTRYFRIFFLRSVRGGTLLDRLVAKAVKDYSRLFGYDDIDNISHIAVQFDDLFVETLVDGTQLSIFQLSEDEDFYGFMPRLEGYWELNLDNYTDDFIEACKFVIRKQVGKKLDVTGCLKYAAEKSIAELVGFEAEEEDSLGETKAHIRNNTLHFSLPYTCCSVANVLLWKLLEVEPSSDSLIAPNLYLICWMLSSLGEGQFYTTQNVEVNFY